MLKRILLALEITVFLLFSIAGLTACGQHKFYEDGYFQYVIARKHIASTGKVDNFVAIIGLTELGKLQVTIDIPRFIDGIEVRQMGYEMGGTMMGKTYHHIESPNLKKVYIHDNISAIESEVFSFFDSISIMVCGTNPVFIEDDQTGFFIYKELYDEVDEHYYTLDDGRLIYHWQIFQLNPANIVFFNNYSIEINRGYYRLDNIEAVEKIPQPPAPEREGYIFMGWFTEPTCHNPWDFDNTLVIAENTEFKLYAGWQVK